MPPYRIEIEMTVTHRCVVTVEVDETTESDDPIDEALFALYEAGELYDRVVWDSDSTMEDVDYEWRLAGDPSPPPAPRQRSTRPGARKQLPLL